MKVKTLLKSTVYILWNPIRSLFSKILHLIIIRTSIRGDIIRIVELFLLFLAVYFSYKNVSTSIIYEKTTSEISKDIKSGFKNIPEQIKEFSIAIDSLSEVVFLQKRSVEIFKNDIDAFSRSLVSYKDHLEKITQASKNQLILLEKTQEEWRKQLAQKPILSLRCDPNYCQFDKDHNRLDILPLIVNAGEMKAENFMVGLIAPKEFKLESKCFVHIPSSQDSFMTMFDYTCVPNFVLLPDEEGFANTKLRFSIKIAPTQKFPIFLQYIITHEKGTNIGTLEIPRPK